MRTCEEKVNGIKALRIADANAIWVKACREIQAKMLHPAAARPDEGHAHVGLRPHLLTEVACNRVHS